MQNLSQNYFHVSHVARRKLFGYLFGGCREKGGLWKISQPKYIKFTLIIISWREREKKNLEYCKILSFPSPFSNPPGQGRLKYNVLCYIKLNFN